MKKYLQWGVIMAFVLLFSAVSFAGTTIYFGILPLEQPETMFERFNPLIEYLKKETKIDFDLKLYPTRGYSGGYSSAVRGLVNKSTSFAYLAPVTLAQAHHHDSKIVPLVCAVRGGSPTYVGQIAVRKDSKIKKVKDLIGKKVIGSSRSSTSGNLMPSGMLIEEGIDKSDFAAMDFAGGHDKAALAVLSGDYDACWINDKNFRKFKDQGEGLRAIWVHAPVPEFPICVNTRYTNPKVIEKVKAALLKMHTKDLAALKAIDKKYEKWVSMTWDDYKPIKNTVDKVHGIEFYELK